MPENNYGLPDVLTREAILAKVREHLKAQNRRALSGDICCYRSSAGEACAVGCLMPGDLEPAWVAGSASGILNRWSREADLTALGQRRCEWAKALWPFTDLLTCLQVIHDTFDPSEWGEVLDDYEQRGAQALLDRDRIVPRDHSPLLTEGAT